MINKIIRRYIDVEAEKDSAQIFLTWLKAIRTGLINRLKAGARALWPGADRESSAWRAFSAEFGPDEPVTHAADTDMHSPGVQHYVDHTIFIIEPIASTQKVT